MATTLNVFFFSFQFASVRLTFSCTRANPSLVVCLLSEFGGDDSLQEELREDAATQASASRLAPSWRRQVTTVPRKRERCEKVNGGAVGGGGAEQP